MIERFFGCHLSSSGGIGNAAKNAKRFSINTIQLHPSAPQRWIAKKFAPGVEQEFLNEMEGSCLKQVFFHGIYLINLANPDPQMFHLSKSSLVHYLDLNARIGGAGVIFHVGSLKDEPDEKVGYQRAADGINWILEQDRGPARLILEVAAGSGKVIGDRFEDLAEIYSRVDNKARVGYGLDSQHLWASGYDLRGNLEGVVLEAEKILGIDKIWSIHLNDSKTTLASRKDRHENLGDGLIGMEALTAFINHHKLKHIPVILETPNLKEDSGIEIELNKLRKMVA